MNPTIQPTLEPTTPTTSPTHEPIWLCKTSPYPTWCYNIDIYPSNNSQTITTINVTDIYRSSDVYSNINLTPKAHSCNNPTITFEYEQIDISASTEYIDVKDNSGILLQRCQGNGGSDVQCNVWWTCLTDYNLDVTHITTDTSYQIQLIASRQNNAFCTAYHPWSTNAKLHVTCDGTPIPTINPTANPIFGPTAPTNYPTAQPTLSPTCNNSFFSADYGGSGGGLVKAINQGKITSVKSWGACDNSYWNGAIGNFAWESENKPHHHLHRQ
eukprot:1005345_1